MIEAVVVPSLNTPGVRTMMCHRNLRTIAAASLILLLAATHAAAQDDTKEEIAKLRAEIAKLRDEIKTLTIAIRDKDAGPTFRGKPASFWFDQLNDADQKYRVDALQAIGMLVRRNRMLIQEKNMVPLMIKLLREDEFEGSPIAQQAVWILGMIGPEALPAVMEVARDKSLPSERSRQLAIEAIERMGAKAKPAVPLLIDLAKEKAGSDLSLRAAYVLGNIGPDAKEALPALTTILEMEFLQERKSKVLFRGRHPVFRSRQAETTLHALLKIDPKIDDLIPKTKPMARPVEPGIDPGPPFDLIRVLTFAEAQPQWRVAIDAMKKKYPAPK